jgi:hypothetical protein
VLRALVFASLAVVTTSVFAIPAVAQPPAPAPPPQPPALEAVPAPATPPAVVAVPPAPDRGDFKVVYEKVKNPDDKELQEIFRGTRLLEETAKALNEKLALPVDVTISPRECGGADATYEADKHRISICYEFIGGFAELFLRASGKTPDAAQAGAAVAAATLFALFHETGHALIDLYKLPVTAKPEEAADQLATLVLLGSGKEGGTTAVDSASTLLTQERNPGIRAQLAKVPFWSGHGFDEARLADILCWAYGRDPEAFQELVGDGTLPAARAEGCAAETERMAKVWAEPLAPWLKGWTLTPPPPPPPPPPALPEAQEPPGPPKPPSRVNMPHNP